ncbi:hypothetical protein B0T10DRAFT_451889, partial [Thelonectria olida]
MTQLNNHDTGNETIRLPIRTVPMPEVASSHQPITVGWFSPRRRACDGRSDCPSGSESDSDSEDGAARGGTLSEDHSFHGQRPEIRQLANKRFKEWGIGFKYDGPPHKRSGTPKWRPDSTHLVGMEDSSDAELVAELVVVSRIDHPTRRVPLACPFYVSDPKKYQGCLLQFKQQSIGGLISHIQYHHAQPFYCPICRETFDTVIHRDDHVLEDTCELRDPKPIDGIGQYQIARLAGRDKPHRDEAQRWQRIWRSLFPDAEPPPSPYLDQGRGLAVLMAREFWEVQGQRCVSEVLESKSMLKGQADEKA